ncbi:MAG: tRNA (guanosine(37)-N1)-methyltransferase TrmD [Desulfomonilia bacterium]|nr:tRNA (guanosine(37)-N1)-methyltransferase TrmD [Desulfomonilia bacterium]
MRINLISLFPGMFRGVFEESIIHRASCKGIIEIRLIDLREFGLGTHRVVDDAPYGGGGGMILRPEPLARALESIPERGHTILTTPRGALFQQEDALRLSLETDLTIICGHYEGIDERVNALFVDEELSIGDYVLTGGEIPAMVIVDAVVRLIPSVLGKDTTTTGDSHYAGLLEHPHYTRPRSFRGLAVPEVLLSGNHQRIRQWRDAQSLEKTRQMRPELLERSLPETRPHDPGKKRP